MNNRLEVICRDFELTEALQSRIESKVQQLEKVCQTITNIRVVLESPHKNHTKGNIYSIRIELHIPDADIVVSQDQHDKHAHEDVYVALRDAFSAAKRQLQQRKEKVRDTRSTLLNARVA